MVSVSSKCIKFASMKTKQRIVHINTTIGTGSTVGSLIDVLSVGALDHGYETYVAAGRRVGDTTLDNFALKPFLFGTKYGRYLNVAHARLFDDDGFIDDRATDNLCEWLKKIRPHIVHLHNLHGYYINICRLGDTLRQLNTKVVATMHDSWLMTGHCASIPSTCDGYKTGCKQCCHKQMYPRAWFSGDTNAHLAKKVAFLRNLDDVTIVTPTKILSDICAQSLIGECKRCVINHGVNTTIFNSLQKKYYDKESLKLLSVARQWSENKNFEALLSLVKQMPDEWSLTIVGDIKHRYLSDRINYIGNVKTCTRMAQLYTESDVLLCPSLNESFGLTVIESLACGTPVVVNKMVSSNELLTSSDGAVCDFTNTSAVIDAIKRVSVLRPTSMHSQREMVGKYLNLYADICSLLC